ncbi:MAG: aromatic-ring-hydroxylating dioxygenase subunit beta [Rhodospirillaceae bacterium]|nr:aromatic-ring-hydroxylating dioxygenase subunit beta [Rhodospirillaceae bacterium]
MDAVMTADDLRAAEAFLTHEAHLLDTGRYEEWLALFAPDATYWVPAQLDQADPHTAISLMYDDRRLLETRVRRLVQAVAHATTPRAAASRQVTNLALLERDAGAIVVRSKFTMVEYRRNHQRLFAGNYVHRLLRRGDSFAIAAKRVNLINCEAELEGLVLPF